MASGGPTYRVYFYPHRYLRDRQLDTLRQWPRERIMNPELAERVGNQVPREKAMSGRVSVSWKQWLPVINVKRRPPNLPADVAVYVWGGVTATGPFIVDLDNPYALVGYNLRAMSLWRPILRAILGSSRCLEIRCMSQACRETLYALFDREVTKKARVTYPRIHPNVASIDRLTPDGPRFLFVGTQFVIKGGAALLRAFPRVRTEIPNAKLDIVTHLPELYDSLAHYEGISVHEAGFTRREVWSRFMANADILVHPTYAETFGLVVLEALAHGLAIVATDVYALREMTHDRENGRLLIPPISVWNGVMPAPLHYELEHASEIISRIDTSKFEEQLAEAMIDVAKDSEKLLGMRQESLALAQRLDRSVEKDYDPRR